MSKNKKPLPLLENVEIHGISSEGKGVARVNDIIVFVPFVAPGDVVNVQVTRRKHRYMEGTAVSFVKYSDKRTTPRCKYFGICGGCKFQEIKYSEQLAWKQQIVDDALKRIGHLTYPALSPIIGCEKTTEYRSKLEFGFSEKRWLTREEIAKQKVYANKNAVGFHVPGAFDKIIDIDECLLMDGWQNDVRNDIRSFAYENGITFFNIREKQGCLRNLMLRKTTLGETMILLQFHYTNDAEENMAKSLLRHLTDKFPDTTSIVYVNNLKLNDTFGDQEVNVWYGREYIMEEMRGLKFKIGPKSFFQTNTPQAINLYDVVRRFAALTGSETVYDLYTGTGSIAIYVAAQGSKVSGIEYVSEAIDDARENAALNNIGNTEFIAGDMKDVLTADFIEAHGRPDIVIADPPRAGMHKDVIDTILNVKPRRIVYVSCNPATQARDLALLCEEYHIAAVQPVDMFPMTQHIENVCLLEYGKQ